MLTMSIKSHLYVGISNSYILILLLYLLLLYYIFSLIYYYYFLICKSCILKILKRSFVFFTFMSFTILIYIFHSIIILILLALSNKFYYKLVKKRNFIRVLKFLSYIIKFMSNRSSIKYSRLIHVISLCEHY